MSHGKICYLEIPAITAEASAGFYSSIFGWTVKKRGDGELAFDDTGGRQRNMGERERQNSRRTDTHIHHGG